MAGYVCIAMMEDPPYNMIVGTTEEDPDEWVVDLPLPSHLLCYELFNETKQIERRITKQLGKPVKSVRAAKIFAAPAVEVISEFIRARDEAVKENAIVTPEVSLYMRALEAVVTGDAQKAFVLYKHSAERGYRPAMIGIANTYLNGWGVEPDVDASLSWALRAGSDLSLGFAQQTLDHEQCLEIAYLFHSLGMEYEDMEYEVDESEVIYGAIEKLSNDGSKKSQYLYALALRWCERSVQLGGAEAWAAYGLMSLIYRHGSGVKVDLYKALSLTISEIEGFGEFKPGVGLSGRSEVWSILKEASLTTGAKDLAKLWSLLLSSLIRVDSLFYSMDCFTRKGGYTDLIDRQKISPVHTRKLTDFVRGLEARAAAEPSHYANPCRRFIEWLNINPPRPEQPDYETTALSGN